MLGFVSVKLGVAFGKIAPGGFRILSAVDQVAFELGLNLVITSGSDGEHSGPNDPHHSGNAYDVRSQGLSTEIKQQVLDKINAKLGERFYGFLENKDGPNEHFHFQVEKGTTYP